MNNSVYLRFVKYEHYLAFAGILFIIAPLFSINGTMFIVPYPTLNKFLLIKPFIFNSIVSLIIIGIALSIFSKEFIGFKRLWLIAPAIIIIALTFLIYKDFVQLTVIIVGLVAQEFYWRGVFIEILKRQGFSVLFSVVIAAVLSSISYFLTFYIFPAEIQHFGAFFIFTFISGFIREYSIFACFNLITLFTAFYLRVWWRW